MFRFHKTLDVVTLFKNSAPASLKVHALLKQAAATAGQQATEDQASDHSHQSHPSREEFELDVTDEAPTEDQLKSILEYMGSSSAGTVIKGAKDGNDALRKLKESKESFIAPLTVDWANGRAVAGANESEILKLVRALPKDE